MRYHYRQGLHKANVTESKPWFLVYYRVSTSVVITWILSDIRTGRRVDSFISRLASQTDPISQSAFT